MLRRILIAFILQSFISLYALAEGHFQGFSFKSCSTVVCFALESQDADSSLDPSYIAFDESKVTLLMRASGKTQVFHAQRGHLDLRQSLAVLKGISELNGQSLTIRLNPANKPQKGTFSAL